MAHQKVIGHETKSHWIVIAEELYIRDPEPAYWITDPKQNSRKRTFVLR